MTKIRNKVDEIKDALDQNMTVREICAKYDVGMATVYKLFKKHNLCACRREIGKAIQHKCRRFPQREDADNIMRYKVLVGELEAGNNSKELLLELKKVVLSMNADGVLTNKNMKDILMHILILGL